jgi:hypothetical protein
MTDAGLGWRACLAIATYLTEQGQCRVNGAGEDHSSASDLESCDMVWRLTRRDCHGTLLPSYLFSPIRIFPLTMY